MKKHIRKTAIIAGLILAAISFSYGADTRTLADFDYVKPHGETIVIIQCDKNADELNVSKSIQASGSVVVIDAAGNTIYDGDLKSIKGRGSSSWSYTKDQKPYIMKLAEKAELIDGAGAGKKWALLSGSCYSERAYAWVGENPYMSVLSGFKLYEDAGGLYPIHAVPVELYINGDYRGCYIMAETVQIQSNRVDIRESKYAVEGEKTVTEQINLFSNGRVVPVQAMYSSDARLDGPTGGFILELDISSIDKEDCYFQTANGNRYFFKDPDMPSRDQLIKIAQYVQDCEDAIYASNGRNSYGKYYTDYMDIDSVATTFAVKYIVTDGDVFHKSTFFAVDADKDGNFGRIYSGPAWDFDSCNYGSASLYLMDDHQLEGRILTCKLLLHDDFMQKLDTVLTQKIQPLMRAYVKNGALIDQLIALQTEAQSCNLVRWPGSMDFNGNENQGRSASSFKKDLSAHIDKFYNDIWTPEANSAVFERIACFIDDYDANQHRKNGFDFRDVQTKDYFYNAVNWAVDRGIALGTSSTCFSPNLSCTRAQLITFLHRAFDLPSVFRDSSLIDVKPGDYYYGAAMWAESKRVFSEIKGPLMNPDASVTRAEFMFYIWRAAGSPKPQGEYSFADINPSAYYDEAVCWAAEQGISKGTGNNCFSPDRLITRAEAITLLYNYVN